MFYVAVPVASAPRGPAISYRRRCLGLRTLGEVAAGTDRPRTVGGRRLDPPPETGPFVGSFVRLRHTGRIEPMTKDGAGRATVRLG